MSPIVQGKAEKLAELSIRYHVKRLELFGSAASGAFDSSCSDLDFLIEFEASSPAEHCDRYFGLLEELEILFDRRVDLVEVKAIRNPYFMRRVNESRMLIYAA